ncbi:MAG: nucleotidyltransferase domain-containing protein [Promethearchaeota archaeon]
MMKNRMEMMKHRNEYLKKIEEARVKLLPQSKSYIFGSILEGKLVGGSDIDILIVADVPNSLTERAAILANLEETAGLPLSHVFEIHLISPEEFKTWISIYKLKYEKLESYLEREAKS